MDGPTIERFVSGLPKAELHLHIEGSFEPELIFEIANRNQITLSYGSLEELKAAYKFKNLQQFLDVYYAAASVLIHERDFYDLTWAYLKKIHSQKVLHTEVSFDPQTHTSRGIPFATAITGIYNALEDGRKKLGMSYRLIMQFLRHLSEEAAFQTLKEALPFKQWITAVGLDSSEVGNPPSKFVRVFEAARKEGFRIVAHAGEEGPPQYVWEAINLLKVERVDHGIGALADDKLVETLAMQKMPLTLCPLSNLKLNVVKDAREYPLLLMLEKGLVATINSDDPAYFSGYVNENYTTLAKALHLSAEQLTTLAKNSFVASFLDEKSQADMLAKVESFASQFTC